MEEDKPKCFKTVQCCPTSGICRTCEVMGECWRGLTDENKDIANGKIIKGMRRKYGR